MSITDLRAIHPATLELLIKVAQDAIENLPCNCGYEIIAGQRISRCDKSCTHGMARLALDQLAAEHKADDPHCTCNDCMADYPGELSE